MDNKSYAVLSAITTASKDGRAVILERDDLTSLAPEITAAELSEIIKELALAEYIKLKYQDGDTYCIMALPKAKVVMERELRAKAPEKREIYALEPTEAEVTEEAVTAIANAAAKFDYKTLVKIVFAAAFAGALLPALIFFLLTYLLLK
jgi:hypothetical protein